MTKPYEEGDPSSRLIVLGQAPASYEMRMGRPLVGPAGMVFNECLHLAGVARGHCYILNVWEDPIRTDKSGAIYSTSGGDALWMPKKGFTDLGLDMALPTVKRIQESGANCVLALGQQALELCTGQVTGIMKWRGSIQQTLPRLSSRKVVATIHPAATIHSGVYIWRYMIISDMQRAAKESTSSEFKPPVRNIEIRPRLSQVLDYMHECKKHGRFSTDIEVINHEVACLSLSYRHDEALVVPLTYEDGNYWNENQEARMWLQYASLMSDPEVMKINQNIIGFDALFLLLRNNIHVDGPLGDTMLAHRILYPEFNRGLDFQASMHTREPYWKDEGKMWKNEGGDFETFWRYNGKDGCVALELWDVHEPELRRMGMWNRYEMHANLMKSIMLMTVDGLAIEKNMLTETKGGIQRQLDDLYKELDDVSDYSFNPLSPAQCKNYFYNHKGIHPYKSSTGSITTDDKAVTRIYRKTHLREAKLVQEIRNLSKLKGTYLDVETDSDGRLRCSWDPLGTWTGRLSSSKTIFGTGMNLQNLDPRFKRFIVADGD